MGRLRIKTADGCKAGWTCVDRHAPEGRGAEGRLRVNYLQIACVNLQKPYQAAERYITWDPTQPLAKTTTPTSIHDVILI